MGVAATFEAIKKGPMGPYRIAVGRTSMLSDQNHLAIDCRWVITLELGRDGANGPQ